MKPYVKIHSPMLVINAINYFLFKRTYCYRSNTRVVCVRKLARGFQTTMRGDSTQERRRRSVMGAWKCMGVCVCVEMFVCSCVYMDAT
jgi:hypothetical protein